MVTAVPLTSTTVGDDNEPLRMMVGDFVRRYVKPVVAELDQKMRFPREIYQEMARANLLGITVPEEFGGPGGRALDYLHVMEGLSFGYASVADQCGLVEILGGLLTKLGTAEQKERYLRPLLKAEIFGAYGLTEAHAGSDLGAVRTAARKQPDGSWLLDGEKVFIHNAPVADFAVVLAVTDPAKGRSGGMSVFVVDLELPGASNNYREHKMGQRASQVGGLRFDGVKLPADALLGEEGLGFKYMMSILAKGRLGISGLSLGISRAAITEATEYAFAREAFGRPIAVNQAVSFRLADASTEYRAGLLLAEEAARQLDRGIDATTACSMAKLYTSEACLRHVDTAVQVFGGAGFIHGYPVERLYRDARITTIYEGTSEMQRLIISRSLSSSR